MLKQALKVTFAANTLTSTPIRVSEHIAPVLVAPANWSGGVVSVSGAMTLGGTLYPLYDKDGNAIQANGGSALTGGRMYALDAVPVMSVSVVALVSTSVDGTAKDVYILGMR